MDVSNWIHMLLLCIVNGCFAVAGIFLNLLVVLSFWKSKQLRRKICYFFILVLSCSDLLVVLIVQPMLAIFSALWFSRHSLIPFIFDPFFGFSMFTLLTMNLERYWAVKHPYFHHRSITKRRLILLLVLLWSFVLIISILSHEKLMPRVIPGFIILASVFLVILYINYQMLATVRAKRRNDLSVIRYQHCNDALTVNLNRKENTKSQSKSISTSFLAILCFFVCSSPILIHNALWYSLKKFSNPEIRMPYQLWAQTFLSMNSTFNCVIFYYKTTLLRREGKKILRKVGLMTNTIDSITNT